MLPDQTRRVTWCTGQEIYAAGPCVVANGNKMPAIRYAYVLTNNEFFKWSTTNIHIQCFRLGTLSTLLYKTCHRITMAT